jgi:hypothetical protein
MESALRFVRNMVLTRILMPEAFSDLAIILAVTGAVDAFTEIGIKEAVVQNPQGKSRPFLNGAWWLAFLRGGFLYLLALRRNLLVAGVEFGADECCGEVAGRDREAVEYVCRGKRPGPVAMLLVKKVAAKAVEKYFVVAALGNLLDPQVLLRLLSVRKR